MFKYFKQSTTIIALICFIIAGIISYNNDYLDRKDRRCVVLDKLESFGGHKSSSHFYLILKEERGIIFDLIVSPATYSQSKVGETLVFNLKQMDIRQTPKENLIYFFGQLAILAMGIAALIISLLVYIGKNKFK